MTTNLEQEVADLRQTIADLEQKLRASSIEREELFEQQTATAAVLKVISRSTVDLGSVMDTIARSAAHLCKADLSALSLRDGDALASRGVFHADETMAAAIRLIPIEISDENYIGRAVLTGASACIPDFEKDTNTNLRKFQKLLGFKAILFVPLMRDGIGIGCFSLARNQVGQFSQREIELVNTFADQAVVAIENARLLEQVQERTSELMRSLDELRTAQDRLVQTEKLASLGQLTAGIAHEINSPIGTSLTIASSLAMRCKAFAREQESGQIRRSQLVSFVDGNRDAADQLVANLQRAGHLVQSFKQVAVDHIHAERNSFDLGHATRQMLASLRPTHRDFEIAIDVPDGIMMDSYSAPYGQVLTNLFINAVTHGLGDMRGGRIAITARQPTTGHVDITFADDGKGMTEHVQRHAFDPFYTTDRNQGGAGLGLHIVYNIVTQQLGGRVKLTSAPGQGTTFIISLPLVSPGA